MPNLISKNDILFADMLHEAIIGRDEKANKMVCAAMQAFITEPARLVKKRIEAFQKRKIQAVGVSTDWDQTTADMFTITMAEDNFDLGFEQAFRDVPLGQNQDFWEIYDVANGITFKRVEEGQRIEMNSLSGEVVQAYVDYYGGAVGWTDKMVRFRKVAAIVDLARAFRNKFYVNKADNHYALLAAAGLLNQLAWQGATSDGQLQRDIMTINEGCYQIANRCKDKGYGDTANTPMIIFANPRDKARINAAIRATTKDTSAVGISGGAIGAGSGLQIDWLVNPIFTFNVNVIARAPLIVLPGQKIQKAEALAPTTYRAAKDVLTLNEAEAVWSIYGAAVADTDQVEEISLA